MTYSFQTKPPCNNGTLPGVASLQSLISGGCGHTRLRPDVPNPFEFVAEAFSETRTLLPANAVQLSASEHHEDYATAGIQLPWKPNGTRRGRAIVATGLPVKSAASRITRSLPSRAAS